MTPCIRILFRLALFLTAGCLAPAADAQSFNKAYKRYYKKQQFAAADAAFARYRTHRKYAVPARYFRAQNRLRKDRSLPDLLTLNDEILQIDSIYRTFSPKRAARLSRKYGVDTLRITELRTDVQRWAMAGVRARGTIQALDSLLDRWRRPLPALQPELDSTHTGMIATQLHSEDYDVMTAIVHRHLGYVQPQHYQFSRQMYERLWPAFQEKYSLCELHRYAEDHPNSFVARDCWGKDIRPLFCDGTLQQMLDFEANNAWTAFEPMLLNAIMEKATDEQVIGLLPKRFALLEDLRQRAGLRERLRNGQAIRDTSATLKLALKYIATYAPRYSAYRLLEETLQFFVDKELYASGIQLFEGARPYFPDTLPAYCKSNFDFQMRVKPYIDGLLPVLKKPEPAITETFIAAVNTEKNEEFSPVLNAGQTTLYFATSVPGGDANDTDVLVSRKLEGSWSAPTPVPVWSGAGRQIPLSLTADGNTMLLLVNGKLHQSKLQSGEWTVPVALQLAGLPLIRKAVFSADGRTLILEGSYADGGVLNAPDLDLFISYAQPGGRWSDPQALGSDINTDGDEANPFLSADGTQLYFTSTEFPGLGRSDVFVSRRTGPDWVMDWSKPENLGKKINNVFAHSGFGYVSPDGNIMYFARNNRDSEKGNIWMLQIKE